MNPSSKQQQESIDLFMDHIEPVSTADVRASRSADLEIDLSSDGIELAARMGSAPISLAVPEHVDFENFLDKNEDSDLADMRSMLDSHGAYKVAVQDLRAGRYHEARRILEHLVDEHPGISEYKATLALVRFRQAEDPADKLAEATQLVENARAYPFCVTTHATLGRMYLQLNRPFAAARFLKQAVELEPERSDLLSDLRAVNALIAERKKDDETDIVDPLALDRFPTERGKAPLSNHEQLRRDQSAVPIALGVFAVVAVPLFIAANVLGFGKDEVWLNPADLFFWARHALLLAAGGLGTYLIARRRPIVLQELVFGPSVFVLALIFGLLIGFNAPLSVTKSSTLIVVAMAMLQVAAEELFFRGYLGRVLMRGLVGAVTPVLVSAVLYAAYQLTYVAAWQGGAGTSALYRVGLAAGAGLFYAGLHQKTDSMSVPLLAHAAAAAAMIMGSIY